MVIAAPAPHQALSWPDAQALWLVTLQLNGITSAPPQVPLEDMCHYLLDQDRVNSDVAVLITFA